MQNLWLGREGGDMNKIKVLNLYAGIGGNRKLWPDDKIEVTAVENNNNCLSLFRSRY